MEICDCSYAIMGNKSQKISRQFLLMAAVAVILWVGGCIDPFNEQAASRQAEGILSSLDKVKTAPEPNIPMPEIYKSPPEIVEQVVAGKPEWKLFYFCKYHTSDELKTIIDKLFGMQIFNEKGQATTVPDYAVSSNPATNQLIARCPAKADVDAVLESLQLIDVPPVQVKIDCIISEVYADKTLDRQTSVQIGNLLGEEGDIWAGPSGQKFGTDIATLLEEGDLLPAFPGASLREIGRARMGLKIGYWSKKHNFIALVDLLESKGYLKILMNPTLEVVNGKSAMVSSSQHVPLQQVTSYIPAKGEYLPESRVEYIDVVDSLKITPHVFADGIGLETDILLGSKLTPEGVKQMPIITKKEIENKENRIRQGESLVIGGMRKSEKRDVVRGVPFLKDIPIIGLLFSGRDFEERVVETIFILTPTISTGGVPRTEMVGEVERKHEAPTPQSAIDPFGLDSRKKELQNKTQEAEEARLQANAEKAGARGAIRAAQERVQIAEAASQKARTELTRIQAEAEKIKTEAEVKTKAAEAAKTTADKATADANAAKTAAEKIAADATKTKAESEKAKAEADAKAKAAEAAKAAADKAAAEAATAKAEAEKIAAQALKTKAEAEKIIADAEAEAIAAAKEEADQPKEEPGKTPTEENKAGT